MDTTTIKIHEDTKSELDRLREYRNESYDEVIRKALNILKLCKTSPKLSAESIAAIERARERMKQGRFVTEAQLRKRLGL